MTPVAVLFLVIAVVIIWGGLITATIMLLRQPEIAAYPPGGDVVEAEDHAAPSV